MNKAFIAALLTATFFVRPFADAATAEEQAKAAAFFTEARMQYAHRTEFEGGWAVDPDRDALLKTYDENHPAEFIARSDQWLKKCPVDAKVHLMRAGLLLRVGDVSAHFYHRMTYYGLMTSIAASGDGKTIQTAYKVISVDEEYPFLNHIGAKLKSQGLVEGPCDAMKVDWDGREIVIYFNVSIPMEAMQRSMSPKKKE